MMVRICDDDCVKEKNNNSKLTHVVYRGGHGGRLGTTERVLIIAFIIISGVRP